MEKIAAFQGEHRFLSNFWHVNVTLGGFDYPTVEHAYQAWKLEPKDRTHIRNAATPGLAKRKAREFVQRAAAHVPSMRIEVMLHLLRQKFANAELARLLVATGRAELEEGNTWNDTFWGVCGGEGQNWLGRLLMQVRDEINCGTLKTGRVG